MTTQTNFMPEAVMGARDVAPVTIPETRKLYWSVRRELWENRSLYLAPGAVAAVLLAASVVNTAHVAYLLRLGVDVTDAALHPRMEAPYLVAAMLIMAVSAIVAVFYCLEALHGERSDRSILFWKSLPVSDWTTVLAKMAIPMVVLPVITFALMLLTQWAMLLTNALVMLVSGQHFPVWPQPGFGAMAGMLLFHLVAVHALWYAPLYGWLLLVSAWARRATLLWAVLPPLAIVLVEKMTFGPTYFARMLADRLTGPAGTDMGGGHALGHLPVLQFLGLPGLWIGLVVAAGFLAGAVQLRRSRGPV